MSNHASPLRKVALAVLKRTGLIVLVLISTGAGFVIHAALSPRSGPASVGAAAADAGLPQYTCSMHPKVRSTDPDAKCPQCGMDLIPVEPDHRGRSLREYSVSPAAAALMDIRVEPVRRRFVTAAVRMVGKVDYDETRLVDVTAWVPGRLDDLKIDYTGVTVRKGDHMVVIYSPELLSAQQELLQARDAVGALDDENTLLRQATEATLDATRQKLRLLGFDARKIADIEAGGKVSEHLEINSPAAGIVIHKHVKEGVYVNVGTRIYTIADLTTLWVKLDAYESDLPWLRYGQKVDFTTEAYPGRTFTGTISFIDPVLTDRTRTVKIRLIVPNADGSLKPGMFVKAVARSQVAAGGKVMDAALAGKWISPHHPEIVKDHPGKCDICGVPLVRAESLGYVTADPAKAEKPLVVPVSAALVTGTRAVVYVKIDPSLLHAGSVSRSNWPDLIADLKAHVEARAPSRMRFINTTCPIMGNRIRPGAVTPDLIREYEGKKVAFCCGGCPEKWDKLSEAEKARALAAVSDGKTPLKVFWGMLSPKLRSDLLAVKPGWAPPTQVQHRFVREVNTILTRRDLHAAATWPTVALGGEARALLQKGPANLSPLRQTRLNRLLLAGLFPKALPAGQGGPTFEGRQVVLGPRAGDYYLVRSGLAEGELIVTRGGFKIDSALQLKAKPSMMSPTGGAAPGGHAHHGPGDKTKPDEKTPDESDAAFPATFKHQLRPILAAADDVAAAMRAPRDPKPDSKTPDLPKARAAFARLQAAVEAIDQTVLEARGLLVWKELAMRLGNDGVEGKAAKTEDQARRAARSLQDNIADLHARIGPIRVAHTGPKPVSLAFRRQLAALYASYFAMQKALASDTFDSALAAATAGKDALARVDMKLVKGKDHTDWMAMSAGLEKILAAAARAKDIKPLRESFALYSEQMAALAKRFGPPAGGNTYRMKCPMAFNNRGAIWLQDTKDLRNPYYGAAMLKCGSIQDVLSPPPAEKKKDSDHGTHGKH